jgi:glycosyltransferase involved in cell wall biosynthesis
VRNEASNIDGVIPDLVSQSQLAQCEVLVLNDHSTDDTAAKLSQYSVRTLDGKDLPSGWLGKNFACHQLSEVATAEFLVFIDADVRLTHTAVSSAIAEMTRLKWDFASPYPKQQAKSVLEILIQPLLQWSWFATVPLRIAEEFRIPSMAVANGQFLIIRKSAYSAIGGHEAIKSDVIDDIAIARELLHAGFRGGVMDGSKIANCRMYENGRDLIEGYRKSLWRAFGSPIGSLVAIFILSSAALAPWLFALHGSILGWIGAISGVFSRFIVALKTRSRWESAFLHPISILLLIVLILWSWIGKARGTLTWRDRTIE